MDSDGRDLTQGHTNSDDSEVNVVILAGGSGDYMRIAPDEKMNCHYSIQFTIWLLEWREGN